MVVFYVVKGKPRSGFFELWECPESNPVSCAHLWAEQCVKGNAVTDLDVNL